MKFEDLKLPENEVLFDLYEMHGHLETYSKELARMVYDQMHAHYEADKKQPAPEWRLPDPPPGRKWHRDDWTQDMLPEGYRPLLLGEPWVAGDEILRNAPYWHTAGNHPSDALNTGARVKQCHQRTRRPLPAPVEYIPLGPEDVPPGSFVRGIGANWWKAVGGVRAESITVVAAGNIDWQSLADKWEILRPGGTTWEPCKKPKP